MKTIFFLLAVLMSVQSYAVDLGADRELNCWKSLKSIDLEPKGWYSTKFVNKETRAQFNAEMSDKVESVMGWYLGDLQGYRKNLSHEPGFPAPEFDKYEKILQNCNFPPINKEVGKYLKDIQADRKSFGGNSQKKNQQKADSAK